MGGCSDVQQKIKNYEKWTISYTKDMRIPMTVYTVSINAVFAIVVSNLLAALLRPKLESAGIYEALKKH